MFRSFVVILPLVAIPLFAASGGAAALDLTSADSSALSNPDSTARTGKDGGGGFKEALVWPFSHIVQPVLNILVFPFSAPIHYANKYKVIETGVDAITFGKDRNIFIYPTFNLKPGTSTLVGFNYRHRNMLLDKDYFFLGGNYFANSDYTLDTRYTKRNVFNSEVFAGVSLSYWADRDASFSIPRTLTLEGGNENYSYTDTSYSAQVRLGRPLPFVPNIDIQASVDFKNRQFEMPDVEDSVLARHPYFNPHDRGVYQSFYEFPVNLTLTYDDLDAPYVPTRGSRISLSWTYGNVASYRGENATEKSDDLDHDYQVIDLFAQHYFFLGKDRSAYGLSANEARSSRKFYTDFSWDETLRLWRPENISNTLLNRRVLAVQFRMRQMWEMESGGAPFSAFPTINTRYPLRGYGYNFFDYSVKGVSVEYRWPIDRLVDGVLFDEYAMYGRTWHSFDSGKLMNSWGFGIRVRKPDQYFFRVQIGFHGTSGFVFICTVAPEFR